MSGGRVFTEQQVLDAGGSLWESFGKRRVYLNNWPALVKLEISRYYSGNISSVSLNGEWISNARGKRLMSIKIFWEDGALHGRYGRDTDIAEIIELVTRALQQDAGSS